MKTFKGKAIYNPSGKAGEYSYWACNFYVGCSNGCTYCYLKKGIGKATLGGDKPILKKCFKDEADALEVFKKEVDQNLDQLREHGLFFSFTTDPMLPETIELTIRAWRVCIKNRVPVKMLTKMDLINDVKITDRYSRLFPLFINKKDRHLISFGFTLTGCDEQEPNASSNEDRISSMKLLHDIGFKTWASIEPIIDINSSLRMIKETVEFCDLYKVGLLSGQKYDKSQLKDFVITLISNYGVKFYFKDSLLKQAGISREDLPSNCMSRDYNMFTNQ